MSKYHPVASPVLGCHAYACDKTGCTVLVGIEDGKWHMSIANPIRYPTWDEIKEARYMFVSGKVTMAMILPPNDQYVNVHPNCFHLHEIEDDERKRIIQA